MHVLFDSVDLAQIPAGAPAVAGYVDGDWPTFPLLAKGWPNSRRLSIAVSPRQNAEVLDVETGDAVAGDVVRWVNVQRARGATRPCIYASLSTMLLAVHPALRASRLPRTSYRLWVADYTDVPHIPPGYGACQWTCTALGRNLDESLCLPGFFDAVP